MRVDLRRSPGAVAVAVASAALTVYNVIVAAQRADTSKALAEQVSELVLVPSNTALTHWYFWNICTAHFCDASILKALVLTSVLFQLSIKVEGGWGMRGYVVFLLLSSTLVGAASSFLMLAMFFAVSPGYFYDTLMCGQAGLLVACMVACVRIDPDDKLLQSNVKTRLALLPALFLYSLLWFLDWRLSLHKGLESESWVFDLYFAWLSFFISFLLLKLYDFTQDDSLWAPRPAYADDPFCFDAFFPDMLRPFVRAFSILAENLFRKVCGACLRRVQSSPPVNTLPLYSVNESHYVHNRTTVSGSTGLMAKKLSANKSNPIADRRRARALKALDQKLAQMSKEPEVALDENENEEDLDNADSVVREEHRPSASSSQDSPEIPAQAKPEQEQMENV